MDNDALDWKKVFKKFLDEPKQFAEDKSSCFRDMKGSSSAFDFEPEDKELRGSVTSSSSSFDSSSSDESSFFKNSGKKLQSFHELTVRGKVACKLNNQDATGSIKHNYNFPKSDKNIKVPEWNKVFKSILDKKPPSPAMEYRKISFLNMKEQENFEKHGDTVNTGCGSRVPEAEETPEEKKVRELFAMSRLFNLDYHKNLNEFEGAGVDIFKCDKKSFSKSLFNSTDKAVENEQFVPMKGFDASLKPYTTVDLLAAPEIPFIEEPWEITDLWSTVRAKK